MSYHRFKGTMKRAIAGILIVGMTLNGIPAFDVEAANEMPGQESGILGDSGEENPGEEGVQPGENADPGERQPDGNGESEEGQPGSNGESGERQPGGNGESGETQPGGNSESGETQLGGNSESGETQPGENTEPGDDQPAEEDNGSDDESIPGEGQDTEEPGPGTGNEETGIEDEELAEDGDGLNAVYLAQISGNDISGSDISGNDLTAYEPEEDEGRRVVGGYIELPEDRDVSVVDEFAQIYDYEDGIAPLMSDSLPSQYIPEKGTLPLTRDQNPYGSCWAHSAMALAEIDMRKNGGVSADADYSELHLAYFSYNGAVNDPLGGLEGDANYCTDKNFMEQGGNLSLAQYVLANWVGAADESIAPYGQAEEVIEKVENGEEGLPKNIAFTDVVHLQNAYKINLQENPDIAKRMIQEYGGVGTSYCDATQFYNADYKSYYCDTKYQTNHAVTIVGWDDSFGADQFSIRPEGDGAWLIRNSWLAGEDTESRGRNTYFWMSYYDKSLAAGYAFDYEDADNYHHNYQYDGSMVSSVWSAETNSVYTANVFTANAYEGGERLEAVGIDFVKAQTPYTVTIYKNLESLANPESGTLIEEASTSGTCGCEGFYTIPLTNPVNLTYEDNFSVVVKFEAPGNETGKVYWSSERSAASENTFYRCETMAKAKQSFYKLNSAWEDFGVKNNRNLRIKAYTKDDDGGTGLPTKIELKNELKEGVEVGVGDSYQASCTVLPRSAADRTAHWESDTPSVATVDENGLITGVSEGTATITVSCTAAPEVTASFFVEVYSELRSIQITGAARVAAGETTALRTVCSPSSVEAADVQWSSSDERVLTVDSDGVVTGVAPGYASITAGVGEVTGTKRLTCEFPKLSWSYRTSIEGLTLTWPGGPGVKRYQVCRAEGASWTNPKLLSTITETDKDTYSYTDRDVTSGKYVYEILATVNYINGDGVEEKTVSLGRYQVTMPEYYRITYHLNGGENSNNPTSYRVGYSYYVYGPKQRPGYDFAGWYYDEGLTEPFGTSGPLPSGTTGNLDLYAEWTPVVYQITYQLNGGINVEEPVASYTIETDTFALPEPTKEGYVFGGWYTDAVFTNPVTEIAKGSMGNKTLYAKWMDIPADKMLKNGTITMQPESFTYTGEEQEPQITLTVKDVALVEDQDYTVAYRNNKDAGTATVVAEGIGEYYGSISHSFTIEPAELKIGALDKTISVGDSLPGQEDYKYEIRGLLADDRLIKEPLFRCDVAEAETEKEGQFTITPSGADAGPNYTITYENGWLIVVNEPIAYRVVFDVQGHGTAPKTLTDINAGNTIDMPEAPTADGYAFEAWCKDSACTQDWDFDTDIVQSNLTLYAKWLKKSTLADSQFQLQEIEDIYYYTGKAQKPVVIVYDVDPRTDTKTMLKAGRDYTVKYENNINVNAGGIWKKGSGQGADFNPDIPYVQIIGKGNYTGEVKVNFDIRPVRIVDEEGNPAKKVVWKYTDQFAVANKAQKPFGSIKYRKAMKRGRDYTLVLTAKDVRDNLGNDVPENTEFADAAIPGGYEGVFALTVTGIGNYTGSISGDVYVTDKLHLMKNAKITLGKNQKNVEFTGGAVELTPSTESSADTFTVKLGGTVLAPGEDYKISYRDESNKEVGKATLVVTGFGEYSGTKTASFHIKGKPFTSKTIQVTGIENKVYTGKAITQSDAVLVYNAGRPDERRLTYGTDYTISYAGNVNKGTAKMTFTGSKKAGFSGSFRKSFQISADSIAAVKRTDGWNTVTAEYSKAGAKPNPDPFLISANGKPLQPGKDYTLSYKNNKAVAGPSDEKAPTIVVKGKGNYQGTFSVPFTITGADLRDRIKSGEITIKTTAVAYRPNQSDDYVYRPTVKLMEGKTALRPGKDYTLTYRNHTQADYQAYINDWEKGGGSASAPQAVISVGTDNTYLIQPAVETGQKDRAEITVPLTIYRNKLTKANLRVEVEESKCVYTGKQVKPGVTVSYRGENGWVILTEDDYTVSYGTNLKSGKRAGRVTVSGTGALYGGDVTVNFEIPRKKITY